MSDKSDQSTDQPPNVPFRWSWDATRSGVRALLPLTVPIPFFGLVFGVLVQESNAVSGLAGWSSSWLVFGGAAQIASVVVLDEGGGVVFAVITILVINARHLMYSAALQPRFERAPGWFRVVGPYFLVDQVFAVLEPRDESEPMNDRMSLMLGAGVFWLVLWSVSVAVGIQVGNIIPESWSIEFTVPLLFLGLLINALRDRPGLLAALVSATVAVAARDLQPPGSGLLLAAGAGMTAAALADWWSDRDDAAEPGVER